MGKNRPPSIEIGRLPSIKERVDCGSASIRRAIEELEDQGAPKAVVIYQLIYHAIQVANPKPIEAQDVAWNLVAIAAVEAGDWNDPEDFRDMAVYLERKEKEQHRKRVGR